MRLASILAAAGLAALPVLAHAQESEHDLAVKLSNPVANLISVPLQFNYDCCLGPVDGGRTVLNIQPVVPFTLNDRWNLIVRTIVPVIYQERTSPSVGPASGLGDTTQSFFFSPKAPVHGWILAAGPAVLLPTGESELGTKQWGAGPTVLALKQEHGFTYGVLANHIWSFADLGDNTGRPDVSSTFVQPFLSWTSPTATTLGINSEASYNWQSGQWSIPINLSITHLYKVGAQRVSLGGGARVYPAHDGTGPEWGLRFIATLLYPR
jgi:hypothetical protein